MSLAFGVVLVVIFALPTTYAHYVRKKFLRGNHAFLDGVATCPMTPMAILLILPAQATSESMTEQCFWKWLASNLSVWLL